jgi:hypothetical protein
MMMMAVNDNDNSNNNNNNNNRQWYILGVDLFPFRFPSLPFRLLSLSPTSISHACRQAAAGLADRMRTHISKHLHTLAAQASVDHETRGKNMRATSVFLL